MDDTNNGLEQGDRSCDPEAHPEKPHRADYGEAERMKENRDGGAGEGSLSLPPRQGRVEPHPRPLFLPSGPSEKLNRYRRQ